MLKGRRTSKIRPEFVIFDPECGQTSGSTALACSNNGLDASSACHGYNPAVSPTATATTTTTAATTTNASSSTMMIPDRSQLQQPSCSDDSDNDRDTVELCGGSPRFRRKNRRKGRTSYERSGHCNNDEDDASYADTLPEVSVYMPGLCVCVCDAAVYLVKSKVEVNCIDAHENIKL